MLNAHPEIVSVGELVNLPHQLMYKNIKKKNYRPCTCGAQSLWACEFWCGIMENIRQVTGISLSESDLQELNKSDELQAELFKSISKISGKNIIVDSSKLPSRLANLMRISDLEVYPIHLIRNPKGQVYSMTKKHGGFLKHVIRYELVHDRLYRQLRSVCHAVVHYEDLVAQPEQALSRILEPLGLVFHSQQLSWAEQAKHNVAGNRMRRQSHSDLILDEKWKSDLNSFQKSIIDLGTLGSRRILPKFQVRKTS
jgi:hypothetical protein